ncbi:4663_t:CDS:2 [Paraglomus occultum]|uniref:4663_t:CDS:1 n=1 Tax=Paraglomus occultum TaxID=144539 RepID=A0A9N9DGW8_9GLOM|nr:4663_t:CDS:2 [Paraglomus occultum]
MGFAPELFACEQVAGGWYIVVMELLMEYCTAYSLAEEYHLSYRTLKQVKTMSSVKLVDFDWAGKIGEAIYPPLMNHEISWHPEVKFGAEIRPEHDLHMLNRELNNLSKS